MSWLSNIPPGIKNIFRREDETSDTLWTKCPGCGEMIFHRDLEASHQVCPSCQFHLPISPEERLALIFDNGAYDVQPLPETVADPLKFRDEKKYIDRLRENRRKTGHQDAMVIASGEVDGVPAVAVVQNFKFMGGSMGMALGEAFLKAAEDAVARRAPMIVFTASGGARMQEGILSLMQMPRTTIGVQMLAEAGLPYIVVFTHPTTGGVTASYAMLGDIHLSEPGALIGFAGPRVIEQTIREKLPEGFQRAEFLQEKGMIDMVVARGDMRDTLARLVRVLMKAPRRVRNPASAAGSAPVAATPANDEQPKAGKTPAPESSGKLDEAAE